MFGFIFLLLIFYIHLRSRTLSTFYSKTSGFSLLEILNKPVIIAYFD